MVKMKDLVGKTNMNKSWLPQKVRVTKTGISDQEKYSDRIQSILCSHKLNKCPRYDEISFNVVKKCFSKLYEPHKYVFNLFTESGIFPDKFKISRVSTVYKAGDIGDLTN